MRISISKSEIIKSVIQLSEYIGSKSGDYEQVRALTYDSPLLLPWVDQSLTEVGDVLNRLTKSIETDGDMCHIELMPTVTRPTEVAKSIERYATNSVISHWLQLVMPTMAATYEEARARELTELQTLSYYRAMPR